MTEQESAPGPDRTWLDRRTQIDNLLAENNNSLNEMNRILSRLETTLGRLPTAAQIGEAVGIEMARSRQEGREIRQVENKKRKDLIDVNEEVGWNAQGLEMVRDLIARGKAHPIFVNQDCITTGPVTAAAPKTKSIYTWGTYCQLWDAIYRQGAKTGEQAVKKLPDAIFAALTEWQKRQYAEFFERVVYGTLYLFKIQVLVYGSGLYSFAENGGPALNFQYTPIGHSADPNFTYPLEQRILEDRYSPGAGAGTGAGAPQYTYDNFVIAPQAWVDYEIIRVRRDKDLGLIFCQPTMGGAGVSYVQVSLMFVLIDGRFTADPFAATQKLNSSRLKPGK